MKLKKKISILLVLIVVTNFLFCVNVFGSEPNVSAEAIYSAELSTGKVLFEKNSHEKMYPASTTKVMTALLVIENCELTDTATASYNAISIIPSGYSTANIQVGETLTIEDLLYALMLPSANEAANVLAEHVAGSIASFATMMNTRAEELGCENTHFVNANGIHNEDHYSTAYDLYLIAKEAMKSDTFRKIVSTTSYTLPATEQYSTNDRVLKNTNQLLHVNKSSKADNYYYKYCIGIKTGFTTQAQNCLISASSKDGLEIINVVLGAGSTEDNLSVRYLDSIELFNNAYNNYALTTIKNANDIVKTIEIKNGTRDTKNLDILSKDDITVFHSVDIDVQSIEPEVELYSDIKAPIAKGDIIGTATYKIDDLEYTTELLAGDDVEKSETLNILLIIIGVICLLLAMRIMPKKHGKRTKKRR
jgi:D-alanyl-D-alanine carboxypeptidase (penicillin-binding protein 5/6)